jgi:hypothetical protein
MKIKFYTKEEIDIIEDSLINNPKNTSVADIIDRLQVQFNRPYDGLRSKIILTKRRLIKQGRLENLRFNEKPKVKKVITEKKSVGRPRKVELLNFEQQPAEVGVEVPHGMTFEGTPKRIMLHSDHFRIYF